MSSRNRYECTTSVRLDGKNHSHARRLQPRSSKLSLPPNLSVVDISFLLITGLGFVRLSKPCGQTRTNQSLRRFGTSTFPHFAKISIVTPKGPVFKLSGSSCQLNETYRFRRFPGDLQIIPNRPTILNSSLELPRS